jgi:alkanesulfonate monooxygenase SsuD/methylene tetrahydromethanopterin reductase-like flavin-dependent oxidoreductase (luciferase family)
MKAAEDFGFDAVWLAEIHFQKDRSVPAAPLIVASALAACTQRVKIGIAVQVPAAESPAPAGRGCRDRRPYSKGRLEFGVGRSGLPGHYQGFNIHYGATAQTAEAREMRANRLAEISYDEGARRVPSFRHAGGGR